MDKHLFFEGSSGFINLDPCSSTEGTMIGVGSTTEHVVQGTILPFQGTGDIGNLSASDSLGWFTKDFRQWRF